MDRGWTTEVDKESETKAEEVEEEDKDKEEIVDRTEL